MVQFLKPAMATPSASGSRKKSALWLFFSLADDTKYAICNNCKLKVSRGGATTKSFNTTNLISHLKSRHPEEFKKYEEKKRVELEGKQPVPAPTTKQITLFESQDRVNKWDVNDPRAKVIHRKIAEMVALDNQPFSIVEDSGFKALLQALEPRYSLPSRRYITETVIPTITEEIRIKVKVELAQVKYLSFTTDIWTTDISSNSLLSLTAHWLTDSFERKSAVLHAQSFPGSHTGENIANMFETMFKEWSIEKEQVHLIVRDNAANMVKAMKDGGYADLGCFAHTLQLIVHEGVLSQRLVKDTVAVCRKIVGHFKHSPLAYSKLKQIQQSLSLPVHHLKQDEPTRWNSTLYMLMSVQEQKMALGAYCSDHGHSISQLTANQLDIVNKAIVVLNPIEEITKSISTEQASASLIIPFIRALRKTLENHENDQGVQTMKQHMLSALNRRFADVESNSSLVLATILDCRFKDKFFSGSIEKLRARRVLEEKVDRCTEQESEVREPSPKRQKTTVLKCFSDILEEAGVVDTDSTDKSKVDKYLSEPLVSFHKNNSFSWWNDNRNRFPHLANLARQYLSAPPTSVPSERLFSGAGEIYDDKRNRLAPERAETLLFIKNNFSFLSS